MQNNLHEFILDNSGSNVEFCSCKHNWKLINVIKSIKEICRKHTKIAVTPTAPSTSKNKASECAEEKIIDKHKFQTVLKNTIGFFVSPTMKDH